MQRLRFCLGVITLLLVAGIAGPVLGAGISVSPSGDTGFVLQGTGLSGVSGMDITINYDSSTMRNVKVAQGVLIANSMFQVNPNNPGILRIAVLNVSGISGSGNIAAITFERTGSSPGLVTQITASLINAKGAPLEVTASFSNLSPADATATATATAATPSPSIPNPTPVPSSTAGQTTTAGIAGAAPGMTLTMPTEVGEKEGERKSETQKPVEQPLPMPTPVADVASSGSMPEVPKERDERKTAEKKFVSYKSVTEKFKTFSGTQSIENLTALFAPDKGLPYEQEPRIVLSNGKDTLKMLVRLEGLAKSAPNFALESAKLLSLTKGEQGEWIIEALPKKDAHEATLTIFYDETTTNIPLTVTPPLSEQQLGVLKGQTENDFKQFIKERGTKAAPRFDLNKDGNRDYLDDYLFTANYLVKKKKPLLPGKGTK